MDAVDYVKAALEEKAGGEAGDTADAMELETTSYPEATVEHTWLELLRVVVRRCDARNLADLSKKPLPLFSGEGVPITNKTLEMVREVAKQLAQTEFLMVDKIGEAGFSLVDEADSGTSTVLTLNTPKASKNLDPHLQTYRDFDTRVAEFEPKLLDLLLRKSGPVAQFAAKRAPRPAILGHDDYLVDGVGASERWIKHVANAGHPAKATQLSPEWIEHGVIRTVLGSIQ